MSNPCLIHIAEPLRALALPCESLNLDPANARLHDDRNLATIKTSLERFGQRLPIVVQRQGMIVRVGNARLRVARSLGWSHIAALVVDESNVDATAYAMVDNRSAELAEWSPEILAAQVVAIQADGFDVAAIGWNQDEIDKLTGELSKSESVAPPPSADPQLGALEFRVVVEKLNERSQADLIDRLTKEGFACRALMS